MKTVFISNYISPHQLPFADEMYKRSGNDFCFISTEDMGEERKKLGWYNVEREYGINAWQSSEDSGKAMKIAAAGDVAIIGSAPDKYIISRLKAGKLTFKYAERFYKTGFRSSLYHYWRNRIAAWLHHGRFQKYSPYMLCASAYTAADCEKFGNYKNRCYKWGYFPEVIRYDSIDSVMAKKEPASILWAARFIDWKHPEICIEIADRLKNAGYSFTLNMLGCGEMDGEISRMITDRGLGDCVHMPGSMPPEKVREYMEKSQIYMFTSDFNEGWGAVTNEAMNSACAVVASHAIGSVPFLIENGENGVIYENGNIDDLYSRIKHLLDNPPECARLGRAAYRTMTEEWNAETAAERFLQLCAAIRGGDEYPDLYNSGPCSKARILKDDWFCAEKQ